MADNQQTKPQDQTPDDKDGADKNQQTGNLLAGKYANVEDLEKGIREIAPRAGQQFAEDAKLVGDDGLFPSTEAAVHAYKAMERLAGKRGEGKDGGDQGDVDGGDDGDDGSGGKLRIDTSDPVNETDLLEQAGVDRESLVEHYRQNGSISDEHLEAIQKVMPSVTKELANTYIEGTAARAQAQAQVQQQIRQSAAEIAGGEEQLDTLLRSAKSFVPADEIDDINQRLEDPKRYKGALRDMLEHHRAAVGAGKARPLVSGDGGSHDAAPISGRKEYLEALRKARAGDEASQKRLLAYRRNGGRSII